MDIKAGYKTTEFWVTVASWLSTVLVLTGVFGAEEAEGIRKALTDIVMAVASLVISLLYIGSRIRLKADAMKK